MPPGEIFYARRVPSATGVAFLFQCAKPPRRQARARNNHIVIVCNTHPLRAKKRMIGRNPERSLFRTARIAFQRRTCHTSCASTLVIDFSMTVRPRQCLTHRDVDEVSRQTLKRPLLQST